MLVCIAAVDSRVVLIDGAIPAWFHGTPVGY